MQELVLSDSKKVYSASNPAFHQAQPPFCIGHYPANNCLKTNMVCRDAPVSIQTPGSSVAAFSIHLPPDIHTQRHKRRHHKRCIFQPLSFLHLDIFLPPWKKREAMVLLSKGLELLLTAFYFWRMRANSTCNVNFLFEWKWCRCREEEYFMFLKEFSNTHHAFL